MIISSLYNLSYLHSVHIHKFYRRSGCTAVASFSSASSNIFLSICSWLLGTEGDGVEALEVGDIVVVVVVVVDAADDAVAGVVVPLSEGVTTNLSARSYEQSELL